MAWWIEDGWVDSDGSNFSRWASTARRSSSKKAGSFMGAGVAVTGRFATVTIGSRVRDRKVRGRVFRRLFWGGFRRGLRLLRVAFGIRGRAGRLLRRVSWRRRERAAGFRGGGRP